MRLELLLRDPPRAPGDGESAWVACGASTRVCATKSKREPRARASRDLGKILPWRLTGTETEGKKRKLGLDGNDLQTRTGKAKRKGNDETNAMVCSPSAKDE
jgi:hypothetical protein